MRKIETLADLFERVGDLALNHSGISGDVVLLFGAIREIADPDHGNAETFAQICYAAARLLDDSEKYVQDELLEETMLAITDTICPQCTCFIEQQRFSTLVCDECKCEFKVDNDYAGPITCPYCEALVEWLPLLRGARKEEGERT